MPHRKPREIRKVKTSMQTSNHYLPAAEFNGREKQCSGRVQVWVVVVSGLVVIGALSLRWLIQNDDPPALPPSIDLTGSPPGVVAAITTARDAVLNEPESGKSWGQLAMALRAHEFETEANICFMEAERLDPHDIRWPYLRGVSLAVSDPQAAIECYLRSIEIHPNLPLPRLRLAELYIDLDQLDQAGTHLRAARDLDPGHARTLLDLGRVAFLRGDFQESLQHTKKSAMQEPMKRATHELLAQIYHRQDDRDAAAKHLSIVQQIPEDEMGWHDPYVSEVMELRRDPDWVVFRAQEQLQQGFAKKAITALEEVVAQHPEICEFHIALGRTLVLAGDFRRAKIVLEQAVRRHPDSPRLRRLQGMAHFSLREWKQAVEKLREAIVLKSNYALAYYDLGRCLLQINDEKAALTAFRNSVRFQPNLADAHTKLGALLLQAGQKSEATEHLRIAAQLSPNDPETRKLLRQATH
jgi:tetratricopeptide (TPR) repeat protein